MARERGSGQSIPAEKSVPREALEEMELGFGIFRIALRDILGQVGVFTNPGSLNSEILDLLAEKLGVQNRYRQITDDIGRAIDRDRERSQQVK